MSDKPTLRGERVVLRPATPDDVTMLLRMHEEPSVARWWGPQLEEEVRERVARPGFLIVESGGTFIGLIQFHEETDEDFRHAGIDVSLTTAAQGQGLGTDAVRTLAAHLFEECGHHRIVIDPAADNSAAIRCYSKVGFKPVGILRRTGTLRKGSGATAC